MTALRRSALPLLLAAALGITGCEKPKPPVAAAEPGLTEREQEFNDRKESLLQQLSTCESGSWGPAPRPIYGGRGAFHGRFQFSIRTFMTYWKKRDGSVLTAREAAEYVQDYHKAAGLTWYMIYDLNEPWHWPLCSRKLGIPNQVKSIRAIAPV